MTMTGRPAEGERALAHTTTYVSAGRRVATVPLSPERVDELYRAEDGLRLAALDADGAALAAAAAAAAGALDIERSAVGALGAAWHGGTGSAAMDFLNRQYDSAAQIVSGLRMAADTLRGLRAELATAVNAKIDAAVRIDDRRAGQRERWLLEARAVLGGMADDTAVGIVRGEIAPYVAADIAGDWVTAMTSATESVRAAYDGAIASLNQRSAARFESPALPTAGPTAGAPAARTVRNRAAPAPPATASAPAPPLAPPPAAPVGALPADLGAIPAPAWPQSLAGALPERNTLTNRGTRPVRKGGDAGQDDTKPDDSNPDELKPGGPKPGDPKPVDTATESPAASPPAPPEPSVAQALPAPPAPPEPSPPEPSLPLAAEVPADASADERTPCEIAADELPQVGE